MRHIKILLSTLRRQPNLDQGITVGDSEELFCVIWTIDIYTTMVGKGMFSLALCNRELEIWSNNSLQRQ